MSTVHAPYHFVPLSKWVYMPDWAHLVSHDHPFEDGHSGVIEYTLRNNTPLCVGSDKYSNNVLKFARDPKGNPTIPGSSLKGMIRNVLDIAAFGKFEQMDDFKLSYRDISSKSAYLDLISKHKPVAGWIKYDTTTEKWVFNQCQSAKLHHDEVNENLKVVIQNEDSAIKRYSQLPLSTTISADISVPRGMKKNRWAENLGKGNTEGHAVFTNTRILGRGDKNSYNFSYFFYGRQGTAFSDNIQQQVQNLFDNHRSMTDKVHGKTYDQVQYLQQHAHPEFGIPVFALVIKGQVHSFGFAKMPRVSYKHSSKDLVNESAQEHNDDSYFSLTDLMFGTLRDDALGLKSRIMFSDASLTSKEMSIISKPVVLSNPKPSFLAAYIEQPNAQSYASYGYHDEKETAKLSGWKRYPVKREFTENEPPNNNVNVQTELEMLTENHVFSGRIAFHNLKSDELAALIWALTFNGSQDHYHTLGHAKSIGAGAVQFDVSLNAEQIYSNSGGEVDCQAQTWVERFVSHMDSQMVKGEWLKTPQLTHLLALADEYISDENDFYAHSLSEFQNIKNNKASLDPLSQSGKILSRTENEPERLGSLAFGKGRLSTLVDIESNVRHKAFDELSQAKSAVMAKKLKKEVLAQAEKALQDAPPYEKSLGLLQNIVEGQEGATASYKKDKAKEIREITKEVKTLTLSSDESSTLLSVATQISFAEKDVKKLTKWLEKQ